MSNINLGELEEAAKALVELLREKGTPYTKVVVEADKITLQECTMGIPMPYDYD